MNNLINLNSDSTREDCILWLKQRYNIDLYIDKQQRMKEFNSIIEALVVLIIYGLSIGVSAIRDSNVFGELKFICDIYGIKFS